MKNKYTLKEIASDLNISRATIDRVIYNRGDISPETTRRVLDYLKEVNYKPNRVGKSLAQHQQKQLYILYHDSKNEFFKEVDKGVKAAESEISDFGFSTKSIFTSGSSDGELKILKEVVEAGADGIAISPYEPYRFVDIIDEYTRKGIPIVTFNNDVVNSMRLCYVGTNYYKNGKIGGEVLAKHVKSGKIAVFNCSLDYWQGQERLTGFREAISQYHDIEVLGPYKDVANFDSAYENVRTLLEETPDIKGIFIMNLEEGIISGVCAAVKSFAKKHIDIITIDLNQESIAEIKNGVITASICQDPFSQGYFAVKILFNYIFDGKKPKSSICQTRLDVIYNENLYNYDENREIITL